VWSGKTRTWVRESTNAGPPKHELEALRSAKARAFYGFGPPKHELLLFAGTVISAKIAIVDRERRAAEKQETAVTT
jgi:hypothetical protein